MFQILMVESMYSIGMLLFFICSIGILLFLSWKYKSLIKEAENMSITKRKELKAIKTKFLNSYGEKTAEEKINVEVFVDKAIHKLKFCGFKINTWNFISCQCMIISVVFAGISIFKHIVSGKSIREISPLYLVVFLELYLFFSILSICDHEEKNRILRLTIIEYMENHLIQRKKTVNSFHAEEKIIRYLEEEQNKKTVFSKEMEEELDNLLQEFLV